MNGNASLLRTTLLAALVAFATPASATDNASHDTGTIRHVLIEMFDRPEERLTVDPITVEGEIAVAGWAQGEMGGRALMRRKGDGWQIILCSGDALKEARALQQFGLTAEQAEAMAGAVAAAEAKLDPTLVEKFSRFDGVVMMDADGNHPPVDGHGSNAGRHADNQGGNGSHVPEH